MTLEEAKKQVLSLINQGIQISGSEISIDQRSPDRDKGKFILDRKPARVIAPFNGFHVNINLDWFDGSMDLPKINRGEFYWVVFALSDKKNMNIINYYICDYRQIREWALEFDAPLGRDHRDHADWRGTIEILGNNRGYFRWGDEPKHETKESRLIQLNSIASIADFSLEILPEEITEPENFIEGATKRISINIYERDPNARHACIEFYGYDCQVCRIDFEEIYGEIGKEYIHVHHLTPLSEVGEGYEIDPINELRPVCPNCHAMLHRRKPPISINELKELMR